jgi:hypothetical protein
VQTAQANERQAEIDLGYTDVTAPFDGVVSALSADPDDVFLLHPRGPTFGDCEWRRRQRA